MDAIVGAIVYEIIDNNGAMIPRARCYLHLAFFAALTLVHELKRINEWHAWPFLCSSAASSQKATRSETDFWRGCIGRDNAYNDLFILRSILHGKCA